ncbi:MAG: septation protein A [Hydrogenophilales bacterium CG03_land_8_20_14_0_80_62_28]|nr:septation protein A [Betaproteobacteria bacterium]OIO77185.1 MAG: septation protein A [Hydrogenophilaceae bacterium CG1_02_62_390]PIV22570.1 MAG: septation protein A [Hydrogenophilales bacterium CG03_land_8_20_14_0_80_62_28]PIW39347.1 MAG: septation protein A [Hydrogenophilales bacterium CG15_BIG_FIL_POST_REV_8_21_14_020_62_31]PIW71064.1 MAG: septation protein A [Hydrogenophilales bacterium CG12_big_fil_rev_8_21_14_0_65_61_21]PIX02286.1 MAG: septation protein A [Hydrogenophilales bacterium 
MKLLFDLFPVILFFIAYQFGESHPQLAISLLSDLGINLGAAKPGVFLATVVAILATCVQIAWSALKHHKVDGMLWLSFGLITIFGGATLLLHDENIIKWKPTVLYWLFALTLGLGPVLFERNFIRMMMEKQLTLPDPIWVRLNLGWAAFFTVLGAVNLFVAFSYSTDTWVNFKMFGTLGLMLVFILMQGVYLSRHMKETP